VVVVVAQNDNTRQINQIDLERVFLATYLL